MPPPVLPKLRPSQQIVHHLRQSVRRIIPHKRIHLRRRGRQSNQVKINPPNQGLLVRILHRRQPLLRQRIPHKLIDIAPAPPRIHHRRRKWRLKLLKRPPLLRRRGIPTLRLGRRRRNPAPDRINPRIRRPHPHPGLKIMNHRIRQFPPAIIRRHLQILIGIPKRNNQPRGIRVPRNNLDPILPTLAQPPARIEQKRPLDFLRPRRVATVTLAHQDRPNLRLKKRPLIIRNSRNRPPRRRRHRLPKNTNFPIPEHPQQKRKATRHPNPWQTQGDKPNPRHISTASNAPFLSSNGRGVAIL